MEYSLLASTPILGRRRWSFDRSGIDLVWKITCCSLDSCESFEKLARVPNLRILSKELPLACCRAKTLLNAFVNEKEILACLYYCVVFRLQCVEVVVNCCRVI